MKPLTANPKLGNENGWQDRHNAAVSSIWPSESYRHTRNVRYKLEDSIIHGLKAWGYYADAHRAAYDSPIGHDILGPHWREWGLALRGLLNGDVGPRLDCGTLDAWILDTLAENGVELEPTPKRMTTGEVLNKWADDGTNGDSLHPNWGMGEDE